MQESRANDEQIAYWNEKAGPKWVAMQQRLDAQLAPLGDALLERAALLPGERVLDIGCGCGSTTLEAAARVGPGAAVIGADISRPMLERARERAAAAGLNNTVFTEADAQVFPFVQGQADAVISRFGVMFFADPAAAFTNIRRALTSAGRLCFICWRPMSENPWIRVPLAAAAKHLELPAPAEPHAPGPFAFDDAKWVRSILDTAGYSNVQVDRHDARLPIGGSADIERSVDFAIDLGPVSALLLDKGDDIRSAVRASIREAMTPLLTPEGVVADFATWIVSARA